MDYIKSDTYLTIYMFSLVFFFVANIQSFLNVVVYRVPKGESFVVGRSHCDRCGAPIGFIYLVPVVGYILSKGRCRNCGEKISSRHVVTEVLWGVLSVALCLMYGLNLPVLVLFLFLSFCQVAIRLI